MKKRIAFTGWWTGWHVFPLVAIYKYLSEKWEYSFLWLGDEDGLEYVTAEKYHIPFYYVPSGKLRRYFDWRNLVEPWKNMSGFFTALWILWRRKVDIVFSKWGYVSLPVCLAAWCLRKKIYIHESDTVAGLANKWIMKRASKVFYTFPNKKIDNHQHILSGQIINPELLGGIAPEPTYEDEEAYMAYWEAKEQEPLQVLIIAGSQGSTTLFEAFREIYNNLTDVHFHIILWEKNLHFRTDFEKKHNITVYDFVSQKKLGNLYQKTDIALTRGGATTLWELYFFGIHSIIVPLSGSAGDHQEKNAQYFKEQFQSDILHEWEDLPIQIFRLINKYKNLKKRGLNTDGIDYALQTIEKHIV